MGHPIRNSLLDARRHGLTLGGAVKVKVKPEVIRSRVLLLNDVEIYRQHKLRTLQQRCRSFR
jgi:hypothetical protein